MSVNQQISVKNQFTLNGYVYDAAGNVIQDGSNNTSCSGYAYTWDAEERETCALGSTYTYNGDGERVKKTGGLATPMLYWGSGGLAESDTSGNLTSEYVFLNGKRIARRDVSGSVYYYFSDQLGSSNVVATAAGAVENESDFYPFGGESSVTQNLANQHYKFTGKERDAESGNDYFGARYYASTMGRFMSPDWSASQDPVPYADLDNPQSLNLYAYVQNNPLSQRDSTGHACDPDTYSTNAHGDTVVTAGACHFDFSTIMAGVIGIGHHFMPKQVWQDIDKASDAWNVLNKVATGALKGKGKVLNRFNRLHRSVNKQTDELVEKLEKDLGKSIEDFKEGDFRELQARLERAGGDVETFNTRMAELEPEARTLGEAMAEALEEVFPAAANAAEAAAPLAGDVAEGAAEIPK
jgi:RHS repeat-associated protein